MINKEFIRVALLKMSLQYPFFNNEGGDNQDIRVETWHEHFKYTSEKDFNYAVDKHIQGNSDTPTIAHIKGLINAKPRETAGNVGGGTYEKDGWIYEPGKPRRRPGEVWCTDEENAYYAAELRKKLQGMFKKI